MQKTIFSKWHFGLLDIPYRNTYRSFRGALLMFFAHISTHLDGISPLLSLEMDIKDLTSNPFDC